ncbi:MAG: hypothetical protein FAF03_06475 [Epsilonproteobacteria bacterium]|nr:hypothetical protein [Campylobacterota bacterium]
MFQHFLITRFNLRKKGWDTTRNKSQVLTDEWMENRLILFENFCYASVQKQTNTNFQWLVFFDKETDEKFRDVIDKLAKDFPLFRPIYIDGMDAFLPAIKETISKELSQPYLITSRLDNDDCLSEQYIENVQKQFDKQDFMAIDYIDGYTLQIEPEVKLGKRTHLHNPFISLIEKSDRWETVWSRERHGEWSKVTQLKTIRNTYVWMSIIHGENKANDFVGFGEVTWEEIKDFHIDAVELRVLKSNTLPLSQWKIQSLRNQLRTYWKVTFKLLKRRLNFNV